MMMLLVLLYAVLLTAIYSTSEDSIQHSINNHNVTTIENNQKLYPTYHMNHNYNDNNNNELNLYVSNNSRILFTRSPKKKPISAMYKKCQSDLQALLDNAESEQSVLTNNSREVELITQLDKEHSIVVHLQQEIQSLQIQNHHLNMTLLSYLYNNMTINELQLLIKNQQFNITRMQQQIQSLQSKLSFATAYSNTSSIMNTQSDCKLNTNLINKLQSQILVDQSNINNLQYQINKLLQSQHSSDSIANNNNNNTSVASYHNISSLRNQLDLDERNVIFDLNKQIKILKLQLQSSLQLPEGSHQNKSSCIKINDKMMLNHDYLLQQLRIKNNTIMSLQQQINSCQSIQLLRNHTIQQECSTPLKVILQNNNNYTNISYMNMNDLQKQQLEKNHIYITSLEQNIKALTLQLHTTFPQSNTTYKLMQIKNVSCDQLHRQIDRERINSTNLALQIKALNSQLNINISTHTHIESTHNNLSSINHHQNQLEDKYLNATRLQLQVLSLQSQLNMSIHYNSTSSSMNILQKKLDDERIYASNLLDQVKLLQSQMNQTLLSQNNNRSSSSIHSNHMISSPIDDLQKQLEDEHMRSNRLEQQLQQSMKNNNFSESSQNNLQIMNITTLKLQKQLDIERAKYADLEQKIQFLFGQQTEGQVIINSAVIKEYNNRIIEASNKELQKELDDAREKSIRLEQQIVNLDTQKGLLVDQLKKGFIDDIRKDAFEIASLKSELDIKKTEITKYKQLIATKEEETIQLKYELKASQSNPLSSSSVSFLKKQHTLHPEMNEILSTIAVTNKEIGRFIKYDFRSARHIFSQNVIFSCALSDTYVSNIARFFAGTARNSGFSGDIVVAVLPDAKADLLQVLREYGVVIYIVSLPCIKSEKGAVVMCNFMNEQLSITLMRMFIYQYWAVKYPDTTYIMMTDFRDVMFQSNPFTSKNKFIDWGPKSYDITMFTELHPNRVITSCRHSAYTLKSCYGKSLHDQIGSNTMVNNGILFATRNASLIYVSSNCLSVIM